MSFEKNRDLAVGCMVGGAFGDCLGAAVEFMSLAQIRQTFGANGITVPRPAYGFSHPVITDDTQMAIATARGLLQVPPSERNDDRVVLGVVWDAYQEWYRAQQNPEEQRAPGSTCLSALAGDVPGTRSAPRNHSAGCGGIMRVHPVGIACAHNPARAFTLGMDVAALTHGHPDGYVPAGVFAGLIAHTLSATQFSDALYAMLIQLDHIARDEAAGSIEAIRIVRNVLAGEDIAETIDASVGQSLYGRGGGWLGHDALAIALFAVRHALSDPLAAVRIAVNHSGDSDSTGSLAGALMGASFGAAPFEEALSAQRCTLERYETLTHLGQQLAAWGGGS